MSELNAYHTLKNRVGRGRWRRIENSAGNGDPDIYVTLDGVTTWLEAKELHGRVRGPWKVDNLRADQEVEMWKLRHVGARVYLLLHRPRRLWLVDASPQHIVELKLGVAPEWLEQWAEPVESVFPPRVMA